MDSNGRLASVRVTEAERTELADGGIPAWQRVVAYWRDSGTLASMANSGIDGARSCLYPDGSREERNACRAYIVDNSVVGRLRVLCDGAGRGIRLPRLAAPHGLHRRRLSQHQWLGSISPQRPDNGQARSRRPALLPARLQHRAGSGPDCARRWPATALCPHSRIATS